MEGLGIGVAVALVVFLVIWRLFSGLLNPHGQKRWRPPANNEPRAPGKLVFPEADDADSSHRKGRRRRKRNRSHHDG